MNIRYPIYEGVYRILTLLDGICLFCSTQELRYLTDAELIETIYAQ